MNAKATRPRLDLIVRGGNTRRYHNVPMLGCQTVAHHSANVAWLCALLTQGGPPRPELLLAALQHDLPEAELGDLP